MSNESKERRKDDTLSNTGENVREGASNVGNEAKEKTNKAEQSAANKVKDLGRDTKEALT